MVFMGERRCFWIHERAKHILNIHARIDNVIPVYIGNYSCSVLNISISIRWKQWHGGSTVGEFIFFWFACVCVRIWCVQVFVGSDVRILCVSFLRRIVEFLNVLFMRAYMPWFYTILAIVQYSEAIQYLRWNIKTNYYSHIAVCRSCLK